MNNETQQKNPLSLYPQKPKIVRYNCSLDKIFNNRIRGWIEPQFAYSNRSKTKNMFFEKYKVDRNSMIYNYAQFQMRYISRRYHQLLSQQAKQELAIIKSNLKRHLYFYAFISFVFTGGGTYFKYTTQWGRLTASSRLPKFIFYSIIFNCINFSLLVRNSQEIQCYLKYHESIENAITTYNTQLHAPYV